MGGLPFKLLLLIGVIVAVWWVSRVLAQLGRAQAQAQASRRPARGPAAGARPTGLVTEDLVKCPRCGTYVSAGAAGPCARGECRPAA